MPVSRRQNKRGHAIGFLTDMRDAHLFETRPCRCLHLICETGISLQGFRTRFLLEDRLERSLPALAECRYEERAFHLLARMSRQIQQPIHLGDRDPFRTIGDFYGFVAGTYFSFLQHAKVESWSSVLHEQGWHARLVHADTDAVAGNARLGHFEYRITNAVPITDADLVIGKSLDGEVLSELAETKITAIQNVFPVTVGIDLVDKYCALLPAMTVEIGLRVAVNVELACHPTPVDRRFPDRRSDSLLVPCHVARKADIN